MPLHETDAFVLRTHTLKEADKICLFFTREAGKVRGVAHGARRMRSRYGASLEPFTEVALVYYQQENRELGSISSCDIVRSPFRAGVSSEQLAVFHYLAELIAEFLPEQEANERVYRLISATVRAIETETTAPLLAVVRYFEIWLLRLSGFCPDWRVCAMCEADQRTAAAVWLSGEGMAMCEQCSGREGDLLVGSAWRFVCQALGAAPVDFLATPCDLRVVHQIGHLLTRLINRILERELRSGEFLDRLRPVEPTPAGGG
ncbi:MAG: DNA repair protein RecO [Blastocatellia bacterium]|jgi:DNA repair protein RecO (recombination protein O)